MIVLKKLELGSILILFGFITLVCSQDCSCDAPIFQRILCSSVSDNTVTEVQCLAAGCCYDGTIRFSLFTRIPNCYQRQCPCNVLPQNRITCGNFFGSACTRTGLCCYDPTSNPFCYRRPVTPTATSLISTTTSPPVQVLRTWSPWGQWTVCSETCSPGVQLRRRRCFSGNNEVSATLCGQLNEETQNCNTNLCRNWGNWAEFGVCRARCSLTGRISVSRICEGRGDPGRANCASSSRDCRGNCTGSAWASWFLWTSCTRRCASGTQYRQRTCAVNGETIPFANCFAQFFTPISTIRAATTQIEPCNEFMCREWSPWSEFSSCVPPCGPPGTVSQRVFERSCVVNGREPINDRERQELEECSVNRLSRGCVVQPCQVTEEATTTTTTTTTASTSTTTTSTATTEPLITSVTDSTISSRNLIFWSTWSTCSSSCGLGISTRIPLCVFPDNSFTRDLTRCNSELTDERRPCNFFLCPNWSLWSEDGCATNCTDVNRITGYRERTRVCLTESQAPDSCYDDTVTCAPDPTSCSTDGTTMEITTETTTSTETTSTTTSTETMPTTTSTETMSTTTSTETLPTTTSTETMPTTTATETISTTTSTETSSTTTTPEIPIQTTTPEVTTTSTTLETTSLQLITWSEWNEWSACSQSCGRGESRRVRECISDSECNGPGIETELCNIDYCSSWSSWSSSCSENCNGGRRRMERVCDSETPPISQECYVQMLDEPCNTMQCDPNVDILFLIDSTDHVDNCRQLRQENFAVPITSEFINDTTTPVYVRIKNFITEFAEGWRSIADEQTNIAIQLMSRECSSSTGRNFYIEKSFNESNKDISTTYIQSLPYRCGSFFLNQALTCAERRVFTTERGDRIDAPNVIIALISRPPAHASPASFLLNIISRRISNNGITIITAGVTQESQISRASQRMQYRELLTAISCPGQTSCPAYIGSIWDEDEGTPAERIRRALEQVSQVV